MSDTLSSLDAIPSYSKISLVCFSILNFQKIPNQTFKESMAILSKIFLIAMLALLLSALSTYAAAPEAAPAPAPAPASSAGVISPSFGFACVSAAAVLLFGYILKI